MIASDKLEAALAQLRDRLTVSDADLRQDLIQHQAVLARATKDRRCGLIDASQKEQTRNRVRYAVLELLREWSGEQRVAREPKPIEDPPIEPESDRPAGPVPTVFISSTRLGMGRYGSGLV